MATSYKRECNDFCLTGQEEKAIELSMQETTQKWLKGKHVKNDALAPRYYPSGEK